MVDVNLPVKETLLQSLAWLEANPDKHIKLDLATDSQGEPVWPTDSDAQCFCALGRFIKDLDLAPDPDYGESYLPIMAVLHPHRLSVDSIYSINDAVVVANKQLAILKLREYVENNYVD